jgi:hypothetical protein
VRSASLADTHMHICYQNNGGLNILMRKNSNLAPAWGATDSDKVNIYLLIHVKIM